MTRPLLVLLAALIFAALTVLSIRLSSHRRRLGVVQDGAYRSMRRCALAAAAPALAYLAAEMAAALTGSADALASYSRLVAWIPFFLLLVAQASFLRRSARIPVVWLACGVALAAFTVPAALRS